MKKVIILLVVLLLLSVAWSVITYWNRNFTGTSTNSYVVADSLVTNVIDDYVFAIENTGTNTLSYKVYRYYGSWSGIYYTAKEDTLDASEVGFMPVEETSYGIKVLVKSTNSGSATTYSGYFNYQKQ
jgi:uncharacterized protein YxeA